VIDALAEAERRPDHLGGPELRPAAEAVMAERNKTFYAS